ncbi:abortive infection family protein [Kribbella sp. DT2]|uniref:abortive infection family protein n=1 Tax=Kribbella sp. DT2 TaxID=3393427 RepID=UPI003CE6CD4B
MTLSWRLDAPPNLVKLVVGRCLIAVMDHGSWTELGLLLDTTQVIDNHPRLLRSLHFGDDDYEGHVRSLVPDLLHEHQAPEPDPWSQVTSPAPKPLRLHERFPKLQDLSDFLSLPVWLAEHDEKLFDRLMGDDGAAAAMPDGTVLTSAESAAARLGVGEMRRQVERIRRDHSGDPEAAIGQAKDLIETVCKTILGMTGSSGGGPVKFPALVKRTLLHLGIDPSQVSSDDAIEARGAQQILGGVSNILHGADELRNARGTGHGRSGSPLVNEALARLAVGAVLPAVVYLIEIYEAHTRATPPATSITLPASALSATFTPGTIVRHETFGEGQIKALTGQATKQVAEVDFGTDIGVKRLLVHYANLTRVV